MIDIRLLRNNPNEVISSIARRGIDTTQLYKAIELDSSLRSITAQRDKVRAEIKLISKSVGQAAKNLDQSSIEALRQESRQLGDKEQELDQQVEQIDKALRSILLATPNIPAIDCPDGAGAQDNVILRTWIAEKGIEAEFDPSLYFDYQRVPHWEIGDALGLLDLSRAAKLSGSMFGLYKGKGAALVRALNQFALDLHSELYQEIHPPSFVRSETMVSTGHLPKFSDDAYYMERDDLWAIPTAEVPLTSMARDEILSESDLPMRFCASTPCYRREAGSAGRDTRGLLRLHEFNKVELLAYATPSQANQVHQEILSSAESILQALKLTYRVVDLCTGDIGNSAARTFDLEVYAPGCDMWLEVSSVSWFSDYQARRANIRYRPNSSEGKKSPSFIHTLNGSALAWPRTWAALVETYRQSDGSIVVPEILRPYMKGMERISFD